MDTININGRTYEVGVDLAGGKDYAAAIIIGDSGCKEALDEIAQLKERGIHVVCVNMDTENMEVLRGFTGITIATSPKMILAFEKASLDYAKAVCVGHIDEETKVVPQTPKGVKQVKIGAVGFTVDHVLELNRQFKELPVPKSIDEMELRGPCCPRKNDNKPWYSRFDKRKRR